MSRNWVKNTQRSSSAIEKVRKKCNSNLTNTLAQRRYLVSVTNVLHGIEVDID
jgi:hypothetical protein